jgi:NAD+ synthase (glutamine-hydrolysing)
MTASLYDHGFVRLAAAVPRVRIADPPTNAARTVELAQRAHEEQAALVAFPELGLTSYTAEDLFHQQALLDATADAIETVRAASAQLNPVLIVGAALRAEAGIYNAAIVIHRGRLLGAAPKSYLPEYREYYEKRQFRAARDLIRREVAVNGTTIPFSPELIYRAADLPGFAFHVEICEDLWAPIPPSTYAAMAGASVLVNLSASNITVGKADYRHLLGAAHSAATISALLYTAAGHGESTTDLAWDGQAMVYENGDLLAEAERFAGEPQLIHADIDLERIAADRAAASSYTDAIHDHRARLSTFATVEFTVNPPPAVLHRRIAPLPYVPADPLRRSERCEEVYRIQVAGLETRMEATGIDRLVIGVSGGLDSAHALIVAARALDRLNLPRANLLAYTMPGFGTSAHTLANARALMEALGVSAHELDITSASAAMLEAIGHPAAGGDPVYDITYENVQAGERTSHLFRLANLHNALVVGTGDLSELALGWSTYGVGDQMSHYAVNASVPKTLIQFLIAWAIETEQFPAVVLDVLRRILDTEISPELIPGDGQRSEDTVGPYELQDFFLYHVLRHGMRPSKVAFLARHAWGERYDAATIDRWLAVFLDRFLRTSQFKRSAIPNAPKVGSGGSLSPRGDWRAPSDGNADIWLAELRRTR